MSEMITVRDLAMVTSDIQYAQRQGARQLASNLIEIGRLLVEAKTMVEPKDWEKYIWDNFGYSTSSADNWMKLFREYGDDQESLFDSFRDSQTFGKLSYTQLLALTALPAEERSAFVAENDVENMSTRQLQQAIKDRDMERLARKEAEEKLSDAYAAIKEVKAEKTAATSELETENKELQAKVAAANKAQSKAESEVKQLKKKLADAEASAKKAGEEAKKAAENPAVPESMMAQMRAEIAAEEAKKAAEGLQKELAEAQKNVDAANRAREEAERKLAEKEKASTMTNPEVIEFKAMLKQVHEDFNRLQGMRKKIQLSDEATGKQLMQVTLQLLDKLREEVC